MSAGVDEEVPDRVAAGVLGHVAGIGDEEAVFGGGGEFSDDAYVVESDGGQLVGARVWKAQVNGVAGDELEVVDRFGADQNRIGLGGKFIQQITRRAAMKVVVLQCS